MPTLRLGISVGQGGGCKDAVELWTPADCAGQTRWSDLAGVHYHMRIYLRLFPCGNSKLLESKFDHITQLNLFTKNDIF